MKALDTRPSPSPYTWTCKILAMEEAKEGAPQGPKEKTKQWIGGEVPVSLYDALKKIAEEDMVPLTVVYRWALSDYVAGRTAR